MLPLGVSVRLGLGLRLGLRLGLSFTFSSFLISLLHSSHMLLLHHRWRMNKFSNFKIHRHICSHCHIWKNVTEGFYKNRSLVLELVYLRKSNFFIWTYVIQGEVRHSFCVCSCMTIFQLLITRKSQLVWSWGQCLAEHQIRK